PSMPANRNTNCIVFPTPSTTSSATVVFSVAYAKTTQRRDAEIAQRPPRANGSSYLHFAICILQFSICNSFCIFPISFAIPRSSRLLASGLSRFLFAVVDLWWDVSSARIEVVIGPGRRSIDDAFHSGPGIGGIVAVLARRIDSRYLRN